MGTLYNWNTAIWPSPCNYAVRRPNPHVSSNICVHFRLTTETNSFLALHFAFPCGLRGLHDCKEVWSPWLNEKLDATHGENNPHDRYAAAAIKKAISRLRQDVVAHLPRCPIIVTKLFNKIPETFIPLIAKFKWLMF